MLSRNGEVVASWHFSISSVIYWAIHSAELIGIYYAISLAFKVTSAMLAIRGSRNKTGQAIIRQSTLEVKG